MNETVLREILGESLRREFAEFDNAPEHKFSLKHRIAMRKIFKRFEKNARGFSKIEYVEEMPHYSLKQRVIFALVIIILMTLLTGWFIPIRSITDAQIDWLRSRYDFPNMRTLVGETFTPDSNALYAAVGVYRQSDEYRSFLDDLEYLGIYSAQELDELLNRNVPMDTRPRSFKNEYIIRAFPMDTGDETPLERAREFVSYLEAKIEYYIERSNDPNRAIEGDYEFAALIKERWTLQNDFLELLEKLYADKPEDEQEIEINSMLNFDKDDRRYLLKTYKI